VTPDIARAPLDHPVRHSFPFDSPERDPAAY
jgi:hypothetical protein